jgi:hypothetical protein
VRVRRHALTLAAAVLFGAAAAELVGSGRLPFDDLRWRAGIPQIVVGDRWLPLRAVQGVPASTLVADDIAGEGPAFVDHFALDLDQLVRRRGSRWGPVISLDVQEGSTVRRVWRLATNFDAQRYERRLESRTEQVDAPAGTPAPRRIDGTPSWPNLRGLSRDDALADLGFLAWHLAHRVASPRLDIPWQAALGAIGRGLDRGITRRDFALQVMGALALFDDGHVRVKRAESGLDLSEHVLPVRFIAVDRDVACVTPDERHFCSQKYPLLLAIDGMPLRAIISALNPFAPRVSYDFHRGEVLDLARDMDLVHGLLGGSAGDKATLLLSDGRGRLATQVVHTRRPFREPRHKNVDVRILPSGDGYLGVRDGWPAGDWFLHEIDRAFAVVRNAPRLIIDVRGNRGGDRQPVLHVLRHLLPPGDPMVDVAAYRMDAAERPPEAFDVLRGRGFHRAATSVASALHAQWPLSPATWSEWQIATLGQERAAAIYEGPVLILVDEQSASATALLTSNLAPLERVTVAGLQGGGGGGWPVDVRLPHSGIVVSLPMMLAMEPDRTVIRAVVPEMHRRRSVQDLAEEMAGQPVPSWALMFRR